jgi:CRP/FNR family transcriptional regulator, dissimilatory nitrate respiration regulator
LRCFAMGSHPKTRKTGQFPKANLSTRRGALHSGVKVPRRLTLVEAGAITLSRPLPHGAPLVLQHARPGAILAEASIFAECYHCEAAAIENAVVRAVPLAHLKAALLAQPDLASAWIRYLAQEVQRTRGHTELLSLKTVAARVDAWIALADGSLPPRGRWRQLAAEIGVTPEALYRELARRRL